MYIHRVSKETRRLEVDSEVGVGGSIRENETMEKNLRQILE